MNVQEELHADALAELRACREAALGTTPAFPPEWGPPISQHWLSVGRSYGPRGETEREAVNDTKPELPSLTVWRWADFEVTATFDIPCTRSIPGTTPGSFATAETVWEQVMPRGKRWAYVGPTANRSSLWRRPLGKVVPFKKKGQRHG
ncbi:hypothetical protein [Actibacterium sp. XHP0104]|uniref:hypothetical protein n=1 Tax=Actibacterium sp. XHP0104 TaxID=2984335 RepID=UPI0021E9426E|nr:hypothetical protein [Actibacterium sp. XHP0104]MCV2881706.1 hypothetical protein [Actibacterium sp. XHP0104]